MSGTNTRATVLDWLVSDREFTEVVANHFRLNFNTVEILSVVHTNNASNHFGNNDHIAKMGLHGSRALVKGRFSLGLAKTLKKSHLLSLQATVAKSPPGASREEVNHLRIGEVKKLLEVNTTVAKLAESSLLLVSVGHVCKRKEERGKQRKYSKLGILWLRVRKLVDPITDHNAYCPYCSII